jgi:hypothetical protein
MSKSTADCKKFIVNFLASNLHILNTLFSEDMSTYTPQEIQNANQEHAQFVILVLTEKLWKRAFKKKYCEDIDDNGFYSYFQTGITPNRYGEPTGKITTTLIASVRGFTLTGCDSDVNFYVLETQDGELLLGEYADCLPY